MLFCMLFFRKVMLRSVLLGPLSMLSIVMLNSHINALVASNVRLAPGLSILVVATIMEGLIG